MNDSQKHLVQSSWAAMAPNAETVAQLFYTRLFEIAPELRTLFPKDMTEQRVKLMQMLAVAVAGLDRLEQIVPAVQALGKRHAAYNVAPADYDMVGAALLWTLKQALGDGFTPDIEAAWAAVYGTLATVMKDAASDLK